VKHRACARHSGAGRWQPGRGAPAGRRAGSRRDFYVFTGHKLYGPTGIGVLYGKHEHLERLPPFNGGGEMIDDGDDAMSSPTTSRRTASRPARRRSCQAIGLGAAIDYVSIDRPRRHRAHEARSRIAMRTERLQRINSLRLIGTAPGQGRHLLVRDEGRACPRRRHRHRPLRRRRAGRHALRHAAAAAVRRHLYLPGLVRPI
jgi:selenocysteine lyase/cysteine desulfurase